MDVIRCTTKGIVPLMYHRPPNADPETGKMPSGKAKGKTDREKVLRSFTYMDKKGLYLPADNFLMLLV